MFDRDAIANALRGKSWFLRSHKLMQAQILGLPDDYLGFLEDLSSRPEVLPDGTIQLKVLELHLLPYAMVGVVFWVQTPAGLRYWDQKKKDGSPGLCLTPATYEYVSWKMGPASGSKGIVRLIKDGRPTHIVIVKATKFATGRLEHDCAGGFGDPETPSFKENFLKEVYEELGFSENVKPKILATYSLGRILADGGMTNNRPYMFCADLDVAEATNINAIENPDIWELHGGALIVPIEQVNKLILENEDAFFLSCTSRMKVKGLIP